MFGPDDTPRETWRVLLGLYRDMPAEDKLRRVAELNRTARLLALAGLKARHPDADDRELRLRCAAQWLDADTMRRAYGWAPDDG